MSHHVIKYDCQCESCDGTGLYRGFAEKNGFAVVCHTCKGSGKTHVKIEYDDFEGRQERSGVTRVLQTNPGISVGMGQSSSSSYKGNPKFLGLESFGGLSYEDWKAGKKFGKGTEMRQFSCPAWWYQSVDYDKKPNWKECIGCGSFSSCENFKNKDKCWNKFDKQNK
jgi:hypothetical protein